jgi:hypothetical protein
MNSDPTGALETIPSDEEQAIRDLLALQRRLMELSKPIRRGQHAKSHGCVRAEFHVRGNLPEDLRTGVFANETTYPAWVRFSNGFGSDDRQPDVHGMGIKLVSVPGAKILPGENSADTQDFLFADHPVFFAPTVRSATDFFAEKVDLDSRGVPPEMTFQLLAKRYSTITPLFLAFVRPADPSPLQTRYWSQLPSLLGSQAVKYMIRPSPKNGSGTSKPEDSPDFLRGAMVAHLSAAGQSASFEFCIQLQSDPASMPIEDATVQWNSSWTPVATLEIAAQVFDTRERDEFAEDLSFTPWHALPAHRPLGGINRARRAVYQMSSRFRHESRSVREFEPTAADRPNSTHTGEASS